VGSKAKEAPVESHPARQLELLDQSPAGPECRSEVLMGANDPLRRASLGLEALPAVPAKVSAPGRTHAAAGRDALNKPSTGGQPMLPRLSVNPGEAAEMLGVSRDYFDEHVIRELRIVRRGRRILIALAELERWLDRAAARPACPRP
jgi:excisionase family DNA binding protein